MVKKLDKQTEKIFTHGELLKSLTENKGWPIAKDLLMRQVAQLLNLSDITSPDPKTIVTLIGIRQETAKELVKWMNTIEGDVEQHKANIDAFADIPDSYIINIEDLKESKL